ncbi:hypothetical protein [Oryza sativa Japonica Group]|uniref:Uncharacterized protein n=1 Tax=Oryza sativa subsp. japonica TaxID=39947 RepID=Q5N9F6_ORYSJ|nr:hypothetical protein [Oryza sativa Japonica Group]BAD81900.1 hypothetical protein [Oryza sativa Japonica Group]
MELAALCTDPVVLSAAFLCLLLNLSLCSYRPPSPGGGRRLPLGPPGVPVLGALPLVGPAPHADLASLARKYGPIMYLKMGTCGVVDVRGEGFLSGAPRRGWSAAVRQGGGVSL